MWVESIVCNISVVFLGHSVQIRQSKQESTNKRIKEEDGAEDRQMAWIKYPASCVYDDQQPEYNAIYLEHSSGNHYNCVKSVLHLGHTYRTDSCEFMLCVVPNINTWYHILFQYRYI